MGQNIASAGVPFRTGPILFIVGVGIDTVCAAIAALPPLQLLNAEAGAVHAAGWAGLDGQLTDVLEDVGRHNALDKLIGALRREGRDGRHGFAVVTSRCSLELIHKAVRARLSTLVSLSAPTDLCVRWARQHHLNLIHLPHHNAPRVYSPGAGA